MVVLLSTRPCFYNHQAWPVLSSLVLEVSNTTWLGFGLKVVRKKKKTTLSLFKNYVSLL